MRSYRIELDPTNKQRTAFLRHAGTARFAYNWGLRRKIEAVAARQVAIAAGVAPADAPKVPTAIDLHRELNALKKTEFPWMYESSKCAPQEALRNLDKAFRNFHRRCKAGVKKKGFPKFKSRKRGIGSFTLTDTVHIRERHVVLPRIGAVRLKERGYLPAGGRVMSATVSERAGHWFVAVLVDEALPALPRGTETLGMDLGIKHPAVLSDGTVFENPRALAKAEKLLRRSQKALSRKQKGSHNRRKAAARVARRYYRVASVRSNAIHQATAAITKRAAVLGVELLNVAGMLGNRHLSRAISDAGMAEFGRQIRYKMERRGGVVIEAGRWFPSSKTCSACGHVLTELPLSVREWTCPACGAEHDRDVNAAENLRNLAGSSPVTACGAASSGPGDRTKLAAVKQEPDTIRLAG